MCAAFVFEECLLKHFVRREVWVEEAKKRLSHLRKSAKKPKNARRLKYFTFCAVGALDVLLLEREKIIHRSKVTKEFDTVYFSDQSESDVIETQKRIPGAVGFYGDFVKLVLQMPGDLEALQYDLNTPEDAEDTIETRKAQQLGAQLKELLSSFPFDVLNLDLEQYLFHPKEELPGNLTNALRKIFEWQTRKGLTPSGLEFEVDEFTLLFTTQIGPPNLPEDYVIYLRDDCLQRNIDTYPELKDLFFKRSNGRDLKAFFLEEFESAFKLAVPKSLIELALENDWHIEGENDGLRVYEFARDSKDGPYRILHMAMTVRRQKPDRRRRGPGQRVPAEVQEQHKKAVIKLFSREAVSVESIVQGEKEKKLTEDLKSLLEYRKRFYDDSQE
jgi:hypothetical protein